MWKACCQIACVLYGLCGDVCVCVCVYFILFTDIGILKKTSCLVSVVPGASLVLPGGEVLSLPKQEAAEEAQVICQISRLLLLLPSHTQLHTHIHCCANYGINGQGPHVGSAKLAPSSYSAPAQSDDNNINRKCWHIKSKSMPLCLYQLRQVSLLYRPGVNYSMHMLPRRGY